MKNILYSINDKDFYKQSATILAPLLLGKILCCRQADGSVMRAEITETEAYLGENDTACHAHRGKTPRTEIMYREGGCAYIYLCYGIHSLLNIVSGECEHPEAVLIRNVKGISGPGRVTKALSIDRTKNGLILNEANGLWIEDGEEKPEYIASPRIGIDYANEVDRLRKWRFTVK